jgi:Neocarzinostatin family
MRFRSLAGVAAAAVVVAAAAAPVAARATQSEPVPTLVVTPDHDLVDGQTVLVEGTGFPAGQTVYAQQCKAGINSMSDLVYLCEARVLATVDATGSFSAFPSVAAALEMHDGSGDVVDCRAVAGACSLVVAYDWHSSWVEAPLTFASGETPPPTITVRPAANIDDGDVVTVSGTGFAASGSISLTQCLHNRPLASDWCDARTPVTATADAAGAFSAQVTVHRGITLPSGEVHDCAPSNCLIAATSAGQPAASAEIELVEVVVLAAALSPATVHPGGAVDLDGSVLCVTSPFSSPVADVNVRGVISQVHDDRVISAQFTATAPCTWLAAWSTRIQGKRTERFKVGTARVVAWGYDSTDPIPDDGDTWTTDVELVRPQR